MGFNRFYWALSLLALFTGIGAYAGDVNVISIKLQGSSDGPSKKVSSDLEQIEAIDAVFLFEVQPSPSKEPVAVGIPYLIPIEDQDSYGKVYNLYLAAFGLKQTQVRPGQPMFPPAQSFQESLTLLRQQSSGLNSNEKILLLSMMGSKLHDGYDFSMPKNETPLDTVFQNANKGAVNGGVCRDISLYLNQVQKALGFENVGMHSLTGYTAATQTEHAVSQFKDPKSGKYYVQNYSIILNTQRKNLNDAVDVSTQIFGVMSSVSQIESQPSRVHQYLPRTTRWVSNLIREGAKYPNPHVRITPIEQAVSLTLPFHSSENLNLKGLILHSSRKEEQGEYELNAVGVAGDVNKNLPITKSFLSEVGFVASSRLGYLNLRNPQVVDWDTMSLGGASSGNPFFSGEIKGFARAKGLTGFSTLEFQSLGSGMGLDQEGFFTGAMWNQLGVGFDYLFPMVPLSMGMKRDFEYVPKTIVGSDRVLKTAEDVVSVVWDNRTSPGQYYLMVGSDVYLFEGVGKMSAVGIKDFLKISLPTYRFGEFSVIADMSRMTENRSGDPFYEADSFWSLTQAWSRALSESVEVGSSIKESNQGSPFFKFDRAPASPVLPSHQDPVVGNVWIRFKF